MDTLLKDVRFGARMLTRDLGSSTISVLALALGIGLTAMMFSIVWGAVLRGLPVDAPEQLVVIDRYSGIRSGRIVIESLSTRPVVLDAVVARPNRFPAATR